MIDLAHAPALDVHCHPWRTLDLLTADPGGFEDRITMTGMCLASSGLAGEAMLGELPRLTESTPLALAMRRRLAEFLGCEPERETVAATRHTALGGDPTGYLRSLWRDAGMGGLVYDEGYPQPTIPQDDFARDSGLPVHRVGRIELWISELLDEVESFAELEEAFVAELERHADDPGLVAFKSIIAYRTGLDVGDPAPDSYCEREFELWRRSGWVESREHGKTLRDRLLYRTVEVARRRDRPLHIHCGGGDPSLLLSQARPQDLFPFLSRHADHPIVLIHSGWPWIEQGAYVASVLPNVYLDVSIMVPWASLAIDQKLEVLLGAAPTAKVLYGSDEASEPEVIWLSALLAREALGRVLGVAVERRWLTEPEAARIGEGVLAGNARRLHGLEA